MFLTIRFNYTPCRATFFLWTIDRAEPGQGIAGHRAGQGEKTCPVTVSVSDVVLHYSSKR